MFGRFMGWYIFGGSCPRRKIHFASKSCAFLYWQRYCTALEYWASAKLCGVEQRAPPVFGSAAITLGIGPYSSFIGFFLLEMSYNL